MTSIGADEVVRVSSIPHPWLRRVAVGALIVLGIASAGLGAVIWLDRSPAGKTTVTKSSTTRVIRPAGGDRAAGTTTTSVSSTDTTTPGAPSIRSETVAATLFGVGAALLLIGVFFGRLEEITLPGGAGLRLTPEGQAQVVEKVAEAARSSGRLDPTTLRRLYAATLAQLDGRTSAPNRGPELVSRRPTSGRRGVDSNREGRSPDESTIDAAVQAAVATVLKGR